MSYTFSFTETPNVDSEDILYDENKYMLIMTAISLALPNIAMLIYKLINKDRCSTFCSFYHCILTNMLCTFLIWDFKLYGWFLLGSIIIFSLVGCNIFLHACGYCCCDDCDCCPWWSIWPECDEIICNRGLDVNYLDDAVDTNRSLPPKITISGRAQHEESREVWEEYELIEKKTYDTDEFGAKYNERTTIEKNYVRTHYSSWGRVDRGGGHFTSIPGRSCDLYEKKDDETRTVTSWSQSYDMQLNTWEDQTCPFEVPYNALTRVNFTPEYIVPDREEKYVDEREDDVRREARRHDTDVYVNTKYSVNGFIESGYIGENIQRLEKMKKFARTCFAKFLGVILFFTGYSFVYECIYRVDYEEKDIKIKKCVSLGDNLRTKWGKRDLNYKRFDYKSNYHFLDAIV